MVIGLTFLEGKRLILKLLWQNYVIVGGLLKSFFVLFQDLVSLGLLILLDQIFENDYSLLQVLHLLDSVVIAQFAKIVESFKRSQQANFWSFGVGD
jgi:hypothetical protein